VRDARALLARLPRVEMGELEIFNAREAARLETYLERFVPADVRAGLPDADSEGIRAAAREGRLVILVPDAAARPDAPEGAIRIESGRYAQKTGGGSQARDPRAGGRP
jgi:hypothetical protein